MKLNFTTKPKEKKKIKDCKAGEAFRWGDSWYTLLYILDRQIKNFGDFYEEHVIDDGMPQASSFDEAIAVIHLGGQALCYVNGEIEPNEWADLSATLCVK